MEFTMFLTKMCADAHLTGEMFAACCQRRGICVRLQFIGCGTRRPLPGNVLQPLPAAKEWICSKSARTCNTPFADFVRYRTAKWLHCEMYLLAGKLVKVTLNALCRANT